MIDKLTKSIDELNKLSSATAVANELKDVGIVGYRHASGNCPVARYLRLPLNIPASDIAVTKYSVLCRYAPGTSWVRDVLLAEPVIEFISLFDAGSYPELLAEGWLTDD